MEDLVQQIKKKFKNFLIDKTFENSEIQKNTHKKLTVKALTFTVFCCIIEMVKKSNKVKYLHNFIIFFSPNDKNAERSDLHV